MRAVHAPGVPTRSPRLTVPAMSCNSMPTCFRRYSDRLIP